MHGTATFPGIKQIISATYTLSHGISPGRAVLAIAPQRNVRARAGTLTFKYGKRTIKLKDMAVQASTITRDPRGWVTSVELLDKRRRWGWGAVSGRYNVRLRRSGIIKPGTFATPRQLAMWCLDALEERKRDVTALPNDTRPEIDWDYEAPAAALSRLCADLGCRVVLKLDGTVKIEKLTDGGPLRGGRIAANSASKAPPEKPSRLIVVGAPVLFQGDFVLEPVGQEEDGEIRHIDDLSYKPAAGWTQLPADEFASETDDLVREAYKTSVYRMYRIRVDAVRGVLPRIGKLESLEQILPIYDRQVDTVTQTLDGFPVEVGAPAAVWGVWTDGNEADEEVNTETELRSHADTSQASFYRRPFQIDQERGIVVFRSPLYQVVGETVLPAELALRTAVNLRSHATRALRRAVDIRDLRGKGPARYIARPDIQLAITGNYTSVDPPRINGVFDNSAVTGPQSSRVVDRELAILDGITRTESASHAGIEAINPDGYIQSVTWSVGAASPTLTTVRANFDPGDIPEIDAELMTNLKNAGVAYHELEDSRGVAHQLPTIAGAP